MAALKALSKTVLDVVGIVQSMALGAIVKHPNDASPLLLLSKCIVLIQSFEQAFKHVADHFYIEWYADSIALPCTPCEGILV